MSLLGNYTVSLSEKGRTAIPKKYRQEIGVSGVIAKWYEGCLVIVGEANWLKLLDKLTGKSEIVTNPVRDTDRFILGSAFEIGLDTQGRFVIPKTLRDFAGLGSEVVFLGLGDRIEVWNKNRWEEREKYLQENAAKLLEEIAFKNRGAVIGG